MCQCGQVRGPVSLHSLHRRPASLCLFFLPSSLVFNTAFPLSRSHLGMFIRLSARFRPDAGPSQVSPKCKYTNTDGNVGDRKKKKKKKEKKGPRRHTHLKDTREKYCTDDVFIQFLIRKPQKCPASFARLRASPMSDTSLVGAPTTLQVLKQNNHCAIPNKRPQKQ